jgi:hypothetical protein
LELIANCRVIFLRHLSFFTMNGPHLCKLRKDCLTCVGHGTTMFAAASGYVKKTPPFFAIFQLSKDGTRTVAHLPIAEGSDFQNLPF